MTLFKPVVALVGRPNVGKSTLFNRLTRSRDALVANFSGLTRDRHYGEGRMGDVPFLVIDTGGFEPVAKKGILAEMAKQTEQAIVESDIVIFLVDARAGVNAHDHEIANMLRRTGRPVLLAVNKAEGMTHTRAMAEFYELGLGEPVPISSAHGDGVYNMIENALAPFAPEEPEVHEDEGEWSDAAPSEEEVNAAGARQEGGVASERGGNGAEADELAAEGASGAAGKGAGAGKAAAGAGAEKEIEHRLKLAIVGRPNVGKSTLINAILGEDRVIAFDMPGTTRDAISIDFERGGQRYTLIDTAGLRKRGKIFESIEKFSVIKTLQAIEACNVVVLVIDAHEDITEQDAHIARFILETGRSLVVALNKWDAIDQDKRDWVKREFNRKLRFLSFAKMHTMSAIRGQGVKQLLQSVQSAYKAAFTKLSTPKLTRVLRDAYNEQPPPRKGIFRPKIRYAHQGGQNPPLVIIHGNALEALSDTYKRFLEARIRAVFKLEGSPLRIECKSSHNPYVE